MIDLTDYEKTLNKNDLVTYWLLNKDISFDFIINSYVKIIENERFNYLKQLSETDTFVAALIDDDKVENEMIKPKAIEYMLNNKRLEGSEWYLNLIKKNNNTEYNEIKENCKKCNHNCDICIFKKLDILSQTFYCMYGLDITPTGNK